jgi:hypothetical protein
MPAILIDFGDIPACHCEDHLEALSKALAADPGGTLVHDMWTPVPNPFARDHVEAVTKRFRQILERLQDAFARVLTGEPIGYAGRRRFRRTRVTPSPLARMPAMGRRRRS